MQLLIIFNLIAIDPGAGTTTFDFLQVFPTTREAALGGSTVASTAGVAGFFYNPSVLTSPQLSAVQFDYLSYLAGIHAGTVSYRQSLSSQQGIGVGLYYLHAGTMKRTNEEGEEIGVFGASFANLNLSGAMRINERIAVGAGLAGIYGNIDTFFSVAVAANLGTSYDLIPHNLQLGFSTTNLGIQIKPFGDVREPLLVEFAVGVNYQPVPALNLSLAFHKPLKNRFNYRLGVEGWVNQYLVLRGGYSSAGVDLSGGGAAGVLAGFTSGLGVRYQRYRVDYSFVPMGIVGFSHRFGFGFDL